MMKANRNSINTLVGILLVFALATLVIAGMVRVVRGEDTYPEDAPDSAFIAQGPIADEQTVADSMAAKTAVAIQYDVEQKEAADGPQGSKDPATVPTPVPWSTPIPRIGIFSEGPLPSGWGTYYKIETRWHDFIGGVSTVVYAGSQSDDPLRGLWNTPEQGILLVKSTIADPTQQPAIDSYLTPTRSGRVALTLAQGTCLTLTVVGGSTQFQFDVTLRQWSCPGNQ